MIILVAVRGSTDNDGSSGDGSSDNDGSIW